jgi:hypothetical protein
MRISVFTDQASSSLPVVQFPFHTKIKTSIYSVDRTDKITFCMTSQTEQLSTQCTIHATARTLPGSMEHVCNMRVNTSAQPPQPPRSSRLSTSSSPSRSSSPSSPSSPSSASSLTFQPNRFSGSAKPATSTIGKVLSRKGGT